MPYLNVDLDYFDHRKTKRLIGLLGRGAEVLPLRLWSYCGKFHCEDGRLAGYSEQEIESLASWWGSPGVMLPAMQKAEWMDREPGGGWFMVSWLEHQGHLMAFKLKGQAMAAARWGRARENAKKLAGMNAASIAESPPQQCPNPPNQPIRTDQTVPTELTEPPEPPKPKGVGGWSPDPVQKRFNALYGRRETTEWSHKEVKAYKALTVLPEDLALLETYYAGPFAEGKDYRRRDLLTLLNNYQGEVDRARKFKPSSPKVF